MTRWNRAGLHWRSWTTPELLQVVHQENIEHFRDHQPRRLRAYLIKMKDEEALIQFDKASMQSGAS